MMGGNMDDILVPQQMMVDRGPSKAEGFRILALQLALQVRSGEEPPSAKELIDTAKQIEHFIKTSH